MVTDSVTVTHMSSSPAEISLSATETSTENLNERDFEDEIAKKREKLQELKNEQRRLELSIKRYKSKAARSKQ